MIDWSEVYIEEKKLRELGSLRVEDIEIFRARIESMCPCPASKVRCLYPNCNRRVLEERFVMGRAEVRRFLPSPKGLGEPVQLKHAEIEAFRLVDLEGLSQEEARERMSISRGTVLRLLQISRKKVDEALTQGRPIVIV